MNPFQKIKNKLDVKTEQENEQQHQRIKRLEQLEAAQNRKGFHIPNPVQSMKDKREIKQLKKEIAAFEESKRNAKVVIGCVAFIAVLICFCLIMAAIENEPQSSTPEATDDVLLEERFEGTSSSDEEVIEPFIAETQITEPAPTEPALEETSTDEMTSPTEFFVGCIISASDLSVSTIKDYAHTDTNVIFLGNQEGVTVSIAASAPNVTWEDLVLIYDETLLKVEFQTPDSTETCTVLKAYITGNKTGESEFFICTEYDLATKGDNAEGYFLDIRKLDSNEGRVVYVTSFGEKYHFSESCAGDSAIKTTYRDAAAYEYEPCGKCAK